MRPAASYVAACVLALPALAAAFRPEVLLAQPGIAAAPSTARRAASRITLLLDPSLAADASAALVPAAVSPGLAPWDAHTLSTLWPDMIHTTIYATVGLMGAYVTQGAEAFDPQMDDDFDAQPERTRPPRPLRPSEFDDDDDLFR
jgi:hypothetical protein